MPRTLVIHTGGIGDFLLALPCIEVLGEAGPVGLLGRKHRLELAVAGGLAVAVHDLDAIEFHTVFDRPSSRFRTFVREFDRAVVWMKDDGRIRSAFEESGVKDVRVFPGLPPETWSRHASEYYLECLGFSPRAPARLAIAPHPEPLDVVIHPGSGSPKKNWPIERFEALATVLTRDGREVAWCLGPAERERGLTPAGRILPEIPLTELASRLAGAGLYIGNDSGVTHLAAAVGCPAIAIFGPTDPRVWAPRGEQVRVLKGNPWVSVEAVARAAAMSERL
jgi:heptosyltransferase-3